MLEIGFVKIDRKITQWRWYHDANTFRVFFHLIVTANYEDKDFEKITVKRGERVISYPKLAVELGLTERNVRTAIKHLKETGEVTVKSYAKFSVITVNNYNQYQSSDRQLTDSRQASDSQVTGDCQSSDNNERKIKKDKESKKDKEGKNTEPDKSEKPSRTSPKKKYGEYKHVELTDKEYQQLCQDYSEGIISDYIRKIDEYLQMTGKKPYRDYNLTIRKWLERDNVKKGSNDGFNPDDYKFLINNFD